MKKFFSLTAVAALLAVGGAFASKHFVLEYHNGSGQVISQSTYNACPNSTAAICGQIYNTETGEYSGIKRFIP